MAYLQDYMQPQGNALQKYMGGSMNPYDDQGLEWRAWSGVNPMERWGLAVRL